MQGIREYNNKISSLRNTMKLTSSMKMISTVKMQKYLKFSMNSELWWRACGETFSLVSQALKKHFACYYPKSKEKAKKAIIIVISSDRGLCGRFNAAIIESASRLREELERIGSEPLFIFIGKKAVRYFARREAKIISTYEIGKIHDFANFAKKISDECVENYLKGEVDEIFLVRTRKISPILNKPSVDKILPLHVEEPDTKNMEQTYTPIIETEKNVMVDTAVRYFIQSQFHKALIESNLCEHSSRMTAMDSASTNCQRLIEEYIQKRNRARQTSITTEISEIVSGKEALSE